MYYEPLHHKYRPQTFADLVGQEAIAQTLSNAINTGKIAPAYLFTGPRGTGKTSSARIFAKSLNCLSSQQPTPTPCGVCEVCRAIALGVALDVMEIDAASNTGVDNMRELIERSQFAPVQCRYKVYVIDECHMLSVAAFNALLKTLEEPPARVVFVLATTDPQRVLPTIISRCQRFDYRRIPLEAMSKHLKYISEQESIEINEAAITLVAQIANGGLRDAESLLDQLSLLSGTITPERVWELVGAVPEQELLSLIRAIQSKNAATVIEQCRQLMNRGKEPLVVLQNLAGFYLNLLLAKSAPNRPDLVPVTATTWTELCQDAQQWPIDEILLGQKHLKDSEVQIKNTTQPRLWLEVTLLGLFAVNIVTPTPATPSQITNPTSPTPSPSNPPETQSKVVELPKPVTETSAPSVIQSVNTSDNSQLWQQVIAHLQPPFARALLTQQCHLISFDGKVAYIGIASENLMKLHKTKVPNIEAAFQSLLGHSVKVHLQVNSSTHINLDQGQKKTTKREPEDANHNGNSPAIVKQQLQPPEFSPSSAIKKPEKIADYSAENLKKIVEDFAKSFEGELIDIPDLLDSEEEENQENTHSDTSRITPIIKNRPNLEGIPEDQLDF